MNKSKLTLQIIGLMIISGVIFSCRNQAPKPQENGLSGDLVIFHAGSLSVPFKVLADSFCIINPGVRILSESAGSLASIRKITDLNKNCDILASADYILIEKLLIPDYCSWNLLFAGNEMAIVYHPRSKFAGSINQNNWHTILMNPEVRFGRSDPDSDPCGYRAILTMKLAEKFFRQPGLTERFLEKDKKYIRPKEVDLLALLESGSIDYIYLYKSVAIQHNLPYLTLPDSINLASPALHKHYQSVSTKVAGSKPGEKITQQGEAMIYGITIPESSENKEAAEAFISFILSAGLPVIESLGQSRITPVLSDKSEMPAFLREQISH